MSRTFVITKIKRSLTSLPWTRSILVMNLTLREGEVLNGRYEIWRLLKRGGMAHVYEARDLKGATRCAIKMYEYWWFNDPIGRKRFSTEAAVTAAFDSPHIVKVHDAGWVSFPFETELPYLVMELLEGEDLGMRLRRGPCSAPEALNILRSIADGLSYAHTNGVVHRDLKPDNVFICADGHAKVLDFGIALCMFDTVRPKEPTYMVGTIGYMAPEQFGPNGISGPWTDVWAFGLISYTILVGTAYSISQLRSPGPRRECPVLSASRNGVRLPSRFTEWFFRCVQDESSERYQDVSQAFHDLETILMCDPVVSSPRTTEAPTSDGETMRINIVDTELISGENAGGDVTWTNEPS